MCLLLFTSSYRSEGNHAFDDFGQYVAVNEVVSADVVATISIVESSHHVLVDLIGWSAARRYSELEFLSHSQRSARPERRLRVLFALRVQYGIKNERHTKLLQDPTAVALQRLSPDISNTETSRVSVARAKPDACRRHQRASCEKHFACETSIEPRSNGGWVKVLLPKCIPTSSKRRSCMLQRLDNNKIVCGASGKVVQALSNVHKLAHCAQSLDFTESKVKSS
uniref:Uncharacterized protein n=1 Tax=Peronospora matthiolae TaxID=2874970 RepID=A0AAV1UU06_9STRA